MWSRSCYLCLFHLIWPFSPFASPISHLIKNLRSVTSLCDLCWVFVLFHLTLPNTVRENLTCSWTHSISVANLAISVQELRSCSALRLSSNPFADVAKVLQSSSSGVYSELLPKKFNVLCLSQHGGKCWKTQSQTGKICSPFPGNGGTKTRQKDIKERIWGHLSL